MESSMLLAVATAGTLIFASLLLTHPSPSSAGESLHYRCGSVGNLGYCYGQCDPGRCCTWEHYCHDQTENVCCWDPTARTYTTDCHECHATSQSYEFGGVNRTLGSGTMGVTPPILNATHNNYLDHDLDRAASDSSSASSLLSLFSCANSLSVMPIDLLDMHPWAALPATAAPEKHVVSKCGLCFRMEKIGPTGGVHDREVKAMIVHEHNNSGIELDGNAFHQLTNSNGSGRAKDLLMVKYQFESC